MFNKIWNLCQIYVSRLWRVWFHNGRLLDYNNEIKLIQAQFNKLKSTKKIQLEANIGTLFRKSIKPKIGLNLDSLDGIINIDFDHQFWEEQIYNKIKIYIADFLKTYILD